MTLFRDFRRIVTEKNEAVIAQDWIGMWSRGAYVVIRPFIPRLLEITYYGLDEGTEKTETKLVGPLNPLRVELHENEPDWPGDWNIGIKFKIPLPGAPEISIPNILKKRP